MGIAILIISVTGATYAYFAIGATNNNTITSTSATANLELTVTKNLQTATNTGVLVPQINTYLGSVVSAVGVMLIKILLIQVLFWKLLNLMQLILVFKLLKVLFLLLLLKRCFISFFYIN